MPGGVDNDVSPFWSFKKSLGGIDGDPSRSLLFEAIHDEGKFQVSPQRFRAALNLGKFIRWKTSCIIKEPSDECAFSVIDVADNDDGESMFF